MEVPVDKAPVQQASVVQAPPATDAAPSAATLGVPVYPGAQFITSYDAGRGQRFYLFGVASSFDDMVTYYRSTLDQRGEELFESPATHQFEIARYRDETMAFPPSVTIKDYAGGGSPGYPAAGPDGVMTHFRTIIQIVPAPRPAQQ
jgi:hypothetical protein